MPRVVTPECVNQRTRRRHSGVYPLPPLRWDLSRFPKYRNQPPPAVLSRHRDSLDAMSAPLYPVPDPEGLPAVPRE